MALVQVAIGPGLLVPDVAPLREGEPVPVEQFEAGLPQEQRVAFRLRLEQAQHDVHEHVMRDRQRSFTREVRGLVADAAKTHVAEELRDVRRAFPDAEVANFLAAIEDDAVATAVALGETPSEEMLALCLAGYRANVVADRGDLTGAPVLVEDYPTHRNLVGAIERVAGVGAFGWDGGRLDDPGGSLVRADGGFLVVRAADVLAEPRAWDALKRVALSGELEPGSASTSLFGLPRSLEPDAIPLDVKLVLIGDQRMHDLLYALDPDFRKLFGVRAEFAADVPRHDETLCSYAAVVSAACEREQLPPPAPAAVAALVEHGAVLAGRADRLSARFSEIVGVFARGGALGAAAWW